MTSYLINTDECKYSYIPKHYFKSELSKLGLVLI